MPVHDDLRQAGWLEISVGEDGKVSLPMRRGAVDLTLTQVSELLPSIEFLVRHDGGKARVFCRQVVKCPR